MSDDAFRGMQSLVQHHVRMFMAVPLQTNDQVLGANLCRLPDTDASVHHRGPEPAYRDGEHRRGANRACAAGGSRAGGEDSGEGPRAGGHHPAGSVAEKAPIVPGLDLAGYNAACRTVGGDDYDFIEYPYGRIGVTLGDVSGKAMPAALLMSSLQARLRVLAEDQQNVAELMTKLNRHTTAHTPSNRFITLFYMLLDPATGELTYSNAGHNPPYLVRKDGRVEELTEGGLIIGMFPWHDTSPATIHSSPEMLWCFSAMV